ncbi:sulfurtransferase TusA family protein [Neomegalonema sp.]|uniref:sulfurtransferase TusA family protein n=1 Tax=Neomegalonema sp. TaxID=2039713 RepID=UPI0026392784|nr:sulfurtransferase TusA family protein [Neomegalonema sp.]MDD2868978.1 sulfurtransferase TusA family protein [Neomegalonema sp.]
MTEEPDMESEMDARGLKCPLPVLKAHKRLQGMRPGSRLRLIADDPAAIVDAPHYCAEQGHKLIDTRRNFEGALIFVIERGGD